MCGIFGLLIKDSSVKLPFTQMCDSLFKLSESRGKEASGAFLKSRESKVVFRGNFRATELIKREEFKEHITPLLGSPRRGNFFIGHSRLVTNGDEKDNHNNQPVETKGIIGVHNGIVTNDKDLWNLMPQRSANSDLDSEALFNYIDTIIEKSNDYGNLSDELFKELKGSASFALMDRYNENLILGTNTGSIYTAESECIMLFASEKFIIEELIGKHSLVGLTINKVEPLEIKIYKTSTQDTTHFEIQAFNLIKPNEGRLSTIPDVTGFVPPLKFLQHYEDRKLAVSKLKRCRKCVLPETMPFITFDYEGVCNYCNSHRPIQTKGDEALMKYADQIRSEDGSVDCIVALSGGRDSTYGLHYVKNILKLNPIAYTYDWGMVTDEARKTSANICGKLGVEHIIVSADIMRKRSNIGKNVNAWLEDPKLGMIPLFMAGDKQFYYYAEQVRKQTKARAVFFSAGNELERTDFKNGFCGVQSGGRNGLLATIPITSKLKLMKYFGINFVKNYKYFNSSLLDTAHAFFSTYLMNHDFEYIYHYHKWDEEIIMKVLKEEYDWVSATDTTASWRIGDGTAAFYNYIYYMVAGFTENDTFRSNQIREGIITREEALKLVEQENEPRFPTIKGYTEMIGVNFESALSKINDIPHI